MMKNFSVIAAVDENWGIGKVGQIPWHHPEDFKWFKHMTSGLPCIMGYYTYLELAKLRYKKKELLPGRKSIVVSQRGLVDLRVTVCNDLNNFENLTTAKENFFIGGASIFEFGLKHSDWAYITRIPSDHQCDVFFPKDSLLDNFKINRTIDLTDTLTVEIYERK